MSKAKNYIGQWCVTPQNIKLGMLVNLGGSGGGDHNADGTSCLHDCFRTACPDYSRVKSISKSGARVTLTNGEVFTLYTCEDVNGTGYWASGESLTRYVKKWPDARNEKLSDDNHRYLELPNPEIVY